jgi:hypothetical protein
MKLDLTSFSYSELTAKLFCIQKDFNTNHPILPEKDIFMKWVSEHANKHFCVSGSDKLPEAVTSHLALFLLGDENNRFTKCLNEN